MSWIAIVIDKLANREYYQNLNKYKTFLIFIESSKRNDAHVTHKR